MHKDGVIKIIITTCAILLLPLTLHADTDSVNNNKEPLIFGILPFTSPVTLLKRFAPLRDYLQQELKTPVILETASNFDEFVLRTHAGRYDFVLTAPHFTLLALDSGKYDLKATYTKPLSAAISVHRDSKIRRIQQLSGKTISTPPEMAIITMAAKKFLQKQQFKEPPFYIKHKTHNASIDAMMIGKTDAAIASINPTRQHIRKGKALRIISVTPPLPGMGLLASRSLSKSLRKQYQDVLINMNETVKGKQALKEMGYPGYKIAKRKEFELTRSFLER